jgi:hypothetical protein
MPEIRVQYHGSADYTVYDIIKRDEMQRLLRLLEDECMERFSVAELVLVPDDFDFYPTPLPEGAKQKMMIVIRITLHRFAQRLADANRNASELHAVVSNFLNTPEKIELHGHRTVGISLLLAEIAYASD